MRRPLQHPAAAVKAGLSAGQALDPQSLRAALLQGLRQLVKTGLDRLFPRLCVGIQIQSNGQLHFFPIQLLPLTALLVEQLPQIILKARWAGLALPHRYRHHRTLLLPALIQGPCSHGMDPLFL